MGLDLVGNALAELRDFVWPQRCIACDGRLETDEQTVCANCSPTLRRLEQPNCPTCALPRPGPRASVDAPCTSCRRHPPPQEAGFAHWLYEGAASRAISRAKYAGEIWRLRSLAESMQEWCRGLVARLRDDARSNDLYLTSVPMHPSDLRDRGFNAAILLARTAFASCTPPARFRWDALEQIERTRPQTGLTRGERRTNVRGVFGVRDEQTIAGRDWLLFDDVSTTGATLAEAAGELVEAGAERVYTVAAARTPRRPTV